MKRPFEEFLSTADYACIATTNMQRGDAPYPLKEAYTQLCSDGSLKLLAIRDQQAFSAITKDAELFEKLFGGTYGPGYDLSALLRDCNTLHDILSAALYFHNPAHITPAVYNRLMSLFSVWMEGVDASECSMGIDYYPSHPDWHGWPWEADCFAPRSLHRSIPFDKLTVEFSFELPANMKGYKKIWSVHDTVPQDLQSLMSPTPCQEQPRSVKARGDHSRLILEDVITGNTFIAHVLGEHAEESKEPFYERW